MSEYADFLQSLSDLILPALVCFSVMAGISVFVYFYTQIKRILTTVDVHLEGSEGRKAKTAASPAPSSDAQTVIGIGDDGEFIFQEEPHANTR